MESDAELIIRIRAGDRDAFADLVDRHRPMLLALCRRTLGDPVAAEDAAHDAILQALLGLDRLRRPERFGAWLCGIGLNLCRRSFRERQAVYSWEDLYGGMRGPDLPDGEPGPEERAEEAEMALRVRQAVSTLPSGQRTAVLLFYLSGLTHAETAATLGIEVGAVKTRLHKARQTLRRHLWTAWKEEVMIEESGPVEVRIVDVVRATEEDEERPRYMVLLEEKDGERRFPPIWIGQPEAFSIAALLTGIETPRPFTYAFAASAVRAVGGELAETCITRLAGDVFYATATFRGPGGTGSVDARPSDAIALALALGAPIRVERALLDELALKTTETRTRADGEGARELVETLTQSLYPRKP